MMSTSFSVCFSLFLIVIVTAVAQQCDDYAGTPSGSFNISLSDGRIFQLFTPWQEFECEGYCTGPPRDLRPLVIDWVRMRKNHAHDLLKYACRSSPKHNCPNPLHCRAILSTIRFAHRSMDVTHTSQLPPTRSKFHESSRLLVTLVGMLSPLWGARRN